MVSSKLLFKLKSVITMDAFFDFKAREFELKINTLEQSENWEIIYQQDITILKKTGSLETLKPNS